MVANHCFNKWITDSFNHFIQNYWFVQANGCLKNGPLNHWLTQFIQKLWNIQEWNCFDRRCNGSTETLFRTIFLGRREQTQSILTILCLKANSKTQTNTDSHQITVHVWKSILLKVAQVGGHGISKADLKLDRWSLYGPLSLNIYGVFEFKSPIPCGCV